MSFDLTRELSCSKAGLGQSNSSIIFIFSNLLYFFVGCSAFCYGVRRFQFRSTPFFPPNQTEAENRMHPSARNRLHPAKTRGALSNWLVRSPITDHLPPIEKNQRTKLDDSYTIRSINTILLREFLLWRQLYSLHYYF